MVLYEVEVRLDSAIEAEWLAWIPEHVARLLALPGFLSAELLCAADASPPLYRIAYRLADLAALEDYLAHHAPRLRAEGEARFGGRFRAERRVLRVERRFPPPAGAHHAAAS